METTRIPGRERRSTAILTPWHRSRKDRLPALEGVRGSRREGMRTDLMRGGGVVDTGASVGADHVE